MSITSNCPDFLGVNMENIQVTSDDFESYESVRRNGSWNMFDPEARAATGLDKDTYIAIIRNYNELKEKYNKEEESWVSTYTE